MIPRELDARVDEVLELLLVELRKRDFNVRPDDWKPFCNEDRETANFRYSPGALRPGVAATSRKGLIFEVELAHVASFTPDAVASRIADEVIDFTMRHELPEKKGTDPWYRHFVDIKR